jgi:hypothetical protein
MCSNQPFWTIHHHHLFIQRPFNNTWKVEYTICICKRKTTINKSFLRSNTSSNFLEFVYDGLYDVDGWQSLSALQLIFPKKFDFEVFILLDCHLQIFLLMSIYYLKVIMFNEIGSHVLKSVGMWSIKCNIWLFFCMYPNHGFFLIFLQYLNHSKMWKHIVCYQTNKILGLYYTTLFH